MNTLPWLKPDRVAKLEAALAERILILDGAMGTMLQRHPLDEAGFRGERFLPGHGHGPGCAHLHAHDHDHANKDLKGNNDLLSLTQPQLIREVHRLYLEAGADLIETNTFNATQVSQADYELERIVFELNREGARLARIECDAMEARTPQQPRFVIGVLGPTVALRRCRRMSTTRASATSISTPWSRPIAKPQTA